MRNNYATYYFDKLETNYGRNTKGTCGYIATAMILSFGDTYWDDNIIEERYEARTEIENDYITFSSVSPGVDREPDNIANRDMCNEQYHQNVFAHQNEFFQFLLIAMGDSLYGTTAGEYGMVFQDYVQLFRHYIYDYRGYSVDDVEIITATDNVRAKTIELVNQGIPVKLSIGGHAVVAFDYDAKEDNIYCHFGLDSVDTHVTIESEGYSEYRNLVAINFKNQHNHSNNFIHISTDGKEESKCVCSTVVPNEINCLGNYLNLLPTFKWNSLIKERWFKDIALYHELSVLDSSKHVVFKKSGIFDNEYALTLEEWREAIEIAGSSYYISIGLASDVDPYWDEYYYLALFNEPTEYLFKTQVKPQQWGFEGRYWFENEGIKTSSLSVGYLNLFTKRLRCGYIEDSYIVLSPRRENAGEAYFEVNFDKKVYSFLYSVCLWSKSENLDGIAIVEVKDSQGNWQQIVDIKAENELKARTEGLNRYIINCTAGIYGVRFTTTATAIGTRNKGRLCIDDLVFCHNPFFTQFISTGYEKTNSI